MKNITIQKNIFSHADLLLPKNETLKIKVLEKERNINIHYDWYESVYDYMKEKAPEKGFDIEKIYFSGFWSQGDGAMFEGNFKLDYTSDIELIQSFVKNNKVQKLIQLGKISIYCRFNHSGHYYHEKSYSHSFDIEHEGKMHSIGEYKNIYACLETLKDDICEQYEILCKEIYHELKSSYDYLQSKEAILETIQANDYQFDEEGNIYN